MSNKDFSVTPIDLPAVIESDCGNCLIARHGSRWVVAARSLHEGQVIPTITLDSQRILVVDLIYDSRDTVCVGRIGDAWVVRTIGGHNIGAYPTYEEAYVACQHYVYDDISEWTIPVDEFVDSVSPSLFHFRVGNRWGVGYRICTVHVGDQAFDHRVVPVTGRFDTGDIQVAHSYHENCHYFVGEVTDGWALYDEHGYCYGIFPTPEAAWTVPRSCENGLLNVDLDGDQKGGEWK